MGEKTKETLKLQFNKRLRLEFHGAIVESAYKSKLKQLKKQETVLVKCRQNIDPLDMDELEALEGRIVFVKEVLSRGKLEVSEFGFFGELFDEKIYVPAGFNAWRESDGELAIGEVTEMDYFRIEGTDKYIRGIDVPPGFWEYGDHDKQSEIIKKNMRAILQLFNIRVLVYPDRVEIKGTIPPQVLYQGEKPEPETGLVITSPSLLKERGKVLKEGLRPSKTSQSIRFPRRGELSKQRRLVTDKERLYIYRG